VTAEDGTTLRTYTLVVTRQISTNANLANLGISGGTLSPAFAAATTTYTSTVNAATTAVTPTVSEANATVTVNGTAVASGTTSGAINLAVGSNVITVKVTAQNGTTVKTYKITVTRPTPSANANLASLTMSLGSIDPVFDPTVTAYTVTVPYNTPFIKVIGAIPADSNAVVRINGAKGQVSPLLPLKPGLNPINISVTAQNGTTVKTYIITVNKVFDTNNQLVSLSVQTEGGSQVALSPSFSNDVANYTVNVNYTVKRVWFFTQSVSDSATVSRTPDYNTEMAFGPNTYQLTVKAQSGATRVFNIVVTRLSPPKNNNANLRSLSISPGTLTPAFAKTVTNYASTVPAGTTVVHLSPAPDYQYANVTVNGTLLAIGADANVPVTSGANLITIKVLATDSVTVKTYKLTVTVQASSANAGLASLTTSVGTLTPAFSTGVTAYSISVPNNTGSIAVHATPSDLHSTIAPGSNLTINPSVGTSTANIVVTAQDGITKKTYTLTITRAGSANANLASLSISQGILSPAFSSSSANYTASVANSATTINVAAATAEPNGSIVINGGTAVAGATSANVNLVVGTNVITTKVTAQDGATVKTYKITITRASGPLGFGNNPGLAYTATESYTPESEDVTVQQAMSPNGDGLNDRLQIDGIESHPDNKLTIIDRNGTLVYEIAGYDNNGKVFDGHSNKTGKLQLPGTYYYVLDYKAGDETKHKTGYLIIKY
jgi:gliding motility-associated-like protein